MGEMKSAEKKVREGAAVMAIRVAFFIGVVVGALVVYLGWCVRMSL